MSNNTILSLENKPKEDKIFLGEFGHFLRIDNVSHDIARKLKEQSEGNTWFAKEVDYKSDKTRFAELPEDAQRAFKLNIAYQTLMDSGVTAGIPKVMQEVVSSSIWSILYTRIAMEECIHSESYSYGLSEVFGHKAEEVLDLVYSDTFVHKRMENEVALFDSVNLILEKRNELDEVEIKKALLKLLIGIYLLESVKFPFSFLVTFKINDSYNNPIQGFTRTIKLIAHDELFTHVPTGKNVIAILKKEKYQGFAELFENGFYEQTVREMTQAVVDQEIEWAKYLFEGREVLGLNVPISEHFIKYQAQIRVRDIFVDMGYKVEKNDIIEWFDNYKDINKQNAALQESTNTSYQKGRLVNDLYEKLK